MADTDKIEAAVLRRLLAHLDERKDVQNIDLMNLAGFCRNCLSKWYMAAAQDEGLEIDYDAARERVETINKDLAAARESGADEIQSGSEDDSPEDDDDEIQLL